MDVSSSTHWKDRLRQERMQRNWRQKDVADHLGTTVVTVRRWERGSQMPSAYFRVKLSALFGKSSEELGFFSFQEPMTKDACLTSTHQSSTSSIPSSLLPLHWLVPYQRNPLFTGRDDIMHRLHNALKQKHSAILSQSYALSGLGGIGKTQTAIEYAYRYASHYTSVFWIGAETSERIISSMVAIADHLNLPEKEEREQSRIVAAVIRWLNNNNQWLLIFDNVEDIEQLKGVLPSPCNGSLLLTSRRQTLGTLAQHVEVEKMTPQEGILFLLRRARLLKRKATPDSLTTSALQDASTLVHLMDGFPLALDQAGAYIDETGCDLAHYRTLYQMNCGLLLARRGQNSQDYPGSVLVTLSASLQQVEGRSLAAANLLRLCAFLSPEAIPEEIFLQEKRACSSATPSLTFDALELDEALAHLRCYSLITRDAGTRMLSIHRMVQAAIQTCMDQSTFHYWIQQAIQTVNSAFPAVEALTTWAQCQRLLSPALACARWIEEEQIVSEAAGRLLHQTGAYLLECALYAQAEIYITQAQAIREQLLGPEHPDVAESLNYIAELAYHKGQYRQAEQLHLQALHIRQRYLGTRHPDVATSLHNLAGVCWAQGRYAQAESLYRQTLQIREATLGLDHLDVGETLQNLAYLLYEQKRYSEAEPLYQRALIICQQVLSPKHVYLTTIFSNLGRLYQAVGRNTEAKTFYRQAKALWDQGRDPNHPYHALILHNLAGLACTEGELIEAETLYQEALQIRESTLGPDHPRTAQSLHDLATFYMKQNLDTQAMRLYQQALAIREKTLGSDHPDTAKTRQCHTQLLAQMGQMDKQTLQGCPGE